MRINLIEDRKKYTNGTQEKTKLYENKSHSVKRELSQLVFENDKNQNNQIEQKKEKGFNKNNVFSSLKNVITYFLR